MTALGFNRMVLMSGAEYFNDAFPINPYMDGAVKVDRRQAITEHSRIRSLLEKAGIEVEIVPAPVDCQDGVYTANWGLCRDDRVVLSHLPYVRQPEELYAEEILRRLGKTIVRLPDNVRFSGQGDALPCGNLLFMGTTYRTDADAHQFVANELGYEPIRLQTVPQPSPKHEGAATNKVTGWPDSFFYDIDLALAVLRQPDGKSQGLIAWCPKAFTPSSRDTIRRLKHIDKIEVSLEEAQGAFACNLISTGGTVIMSDKAPRLREAIESRGFNVYTPDPPIQELIKGGGYIRCTTLTLDNT